MLKKHKRKSLSKFKEEKFNRLQIAALEAAANSIVITDAEGHINWANSAFTALTGYSLTEVFGKNLRFLKSEVHPTEFYKELWDTIMANKVWHGEMINRKKNGTLYTEEMTITPVYFEPEQNLYFIAVKQDVTQRRKDMEEMRMAAKIFENTLEGVLITDDKGDIIFTNRSFQEITGYSTEEVLGKNPKILSSGKHNQEFYRQMWKFLLEKGEWQGEIWNRRRTGEIYPEWLTISVIKDDCGKTVQYAAILSDLTLRKKNEERIKHLAYYDALTDLPNRYLFLDRLTIALAHAARHDNTLAVLFLDLDRFKDVNDTLGHAAGDQLLQEVGRRITTCIREEDTVARMGGDEFTVLLPDIRIEEAKDVARRILGVFRMPFILEGLELFLTPSIGIAVASDKLIDAQTILRYADLAMYKAKENGKNRYWLYQSDMDIQAQDRLTLEQRLRKGLDRNEFVLYYQPQVDVTSGKLLGMEALIRWQNPETGLVPPRKFIPIAEETGLIIPIGEWVLRTAIAQNVAWQEKGLPPLRIAVNLSVRQLQQEDLVERISEILEEEGMKGVWLELEITESMAMQDIELTSRVLGQLKKLGIHIAIDDFGVGYSSLNYLKRFPIDTLKVDQSFIQDSLSNSENGAIVSTILELARELNYSAIVEGVETEAQLEFLKVKACEGIQGYLISRPLPARDMTIFLNFVHENQDTILVPSESKKTTT
ncbi:EAL domain-containing protein [Desulfitobacterium sp.]|uniref:EAL domain-containing protein n=1 Tax=Desulfitobacterium sp. TaxID=49981 RepID=UPI002C687C3D|nr:EAL domain-containing protein [Desulfitobacterium sp.]HVJ48808.1 EAL domain-containing protein [Desulfitobacterium sp.]